MICKFCKFCLLLSNFLFIFAIGFYQLKTACFSFDGAKILQNFHTTIENGKILHKICIL